MAQAKLGTLYGNVGEGERLIAFTTKAFELRDRVSEREKFYISVRYYGYIRGELPKAREVVELWRRTYPRDSVALNYQNAVYRFLGEREPALEAARKEVELAPYDGYAYGDLIGAYLALNRTEEAKAVLEQAFRQKVDQGARHLDRYLIGFLQGDAQAMQREVEWYKGRPDEGDMRLTQAGAAVHGGRLAEARELYAQAIALARRGGLEETAASALLDQAATEALFGNAREARERAAEGLTRGRGPFVPLQAARAFALSGAAEKAQPLIDETARRFPSHTLIQEVELPVLRALVELQRGHSAKAVELVQPAARYELGSRSPYYVLYVSGMAHLRSRAGAQAAAQFQKVLDNRGLDPLSPLYPLSQLGLARAKAIAGDTAQARRAYQDFLALWKDADADIPVLREARAEYAKLKD